MAKPKIYQVDQLQTTIGTVYNQANAAYSQANTGGGPKITSLIYPGDDQAANTVGGQTVYVVGSGFASNAAVYINGNSAPSVSYISAGNLSITTPALSTGTYPVYVINPADGGTAIRIPGLVVSGEPTWNTAASLSTNQAADSAWSYSLSANGDAPITYALAAGSSLPTGVSLNANGVISGTISSPPSSETTYTFSVVASDAQLQDSTRQFSVSVTTGEGVLFANNVLLLHADGTNNGNNHAFVDSSSNNYSITKYGNATQGTFSPFSQTGWSAYFDGTGDYLTVPNNAALQFGAGDFTIECWVYCARALNSGTNALFSIGSYNDGLYLRLNGGSSDDLYINGSYWSVPWSTYMSPNAWAHVAVTRSGTALRVFVNGNLALNTTNSSTISQASGTTIAAATHNTTEILLGYISNFRILKGTALYTAAFTPPTTPLTAIANTSLLTCQSNRFIDNSTNAFTITRNGDASIQAFSPFAPSASYTTANVGGSVYVGGSGTWLSFGTQTAFDCGTSTQFCMETWVYPPTSFPNGIHFWSAHQAAVADGFYFTDSGLYSYSGTPASISSNKSPTIGAWNHCVVTRDAGGRLRYFLNGELTGTSTSSIQINTDNRAVGINGGINFNGDLCYQSQSRYIKGSIPTTYQTSSTTVGAQIFTPPTAALTTTSQGANSSHVIALLNYSNAQIFDQTAKNVLQTVGDAKVSTSVYKYGSGSISFDGNGDYLIGPYNPMYDLGAANFTIEFWMYPTAVGQGAYSYIFYIGNSGNYAPILIGQAPGGYGIALFSSSAGSSWDLASGSSFGTATANAWNHIALVRNGANVYLCLNGTITTTLNWGTTALLSSSSNRPNIGSATGVASSFYTGYIDDLRVTKGYARYTSAFTPPTVAFPNK